MALSIGTQLGSHEITGLLGKGGMGEVYRARDLKLKREVAIKILPEEFSRDAHRVRRFQREAEVLAALNHPNIAAIHDLEEADGTRFLVLELVEGETLADRVSRGPIPLKEALTTAIQICEALGAAHEKGIIHRDLKPANIKVTRAGVAKVLDFGLAKSFSDADGGTNLSQLPTATENGTIIGTPAYMSPEQMRAQIVDKRCDMWAFGCVLFEMLTGRSLFGRETVSDTIAAVIEYEPQWTTLPEHTPGRVRELLRRCLAKDMRHRLHDIADARIELESDALQAAPEATRHKTAPGWRWPLGIGVAALVVAAGLYLSFKHTDTPGPDETTLIALPAQVLGADDLRFLTDAIPNTLSTQLGQVAGLDTKVPPTSIEFETVHRNLGKIAELYGVNTCIVSAITATDPNHVVLSVQLVEPRSGHILWGQQYEGQRGTYLDLARQAAIAIRERLRPSAPPVAAAGGQITGSEAELAYREGIYFSNRYNNLHQSENFDKALAAFQHAFAVDPSMANAAAEISMLYRFRWESQPSTLPKDVAAALRHQGIGEIEQWANRALTIDPRCSRAWGALVWAEYMRSPVDQRKALENALHAVAFATQDSLAHLSLGATLQIVSRELSLPAFLEARRADPLYLYPYFNASENLIALARYGDALSITEDGLRIEPQMPILLSERYLLLILLGRKNEALVWARQYPDQVRRNAGLVYISSSEEGDMKNARTALGRYLEYFDDPESAGNSRIYASVQLVPYLIQQKRFDDVLHVLTGMTKLGDIPSYSWLMLNPMFDPLRSNPKFQDVVARARTQFSETLRLLTEMQVRGELPKYLETPVADLTARLGKF